MRLYETAVVFDPQMKNEEIEDRISKIQNFITNHGGEIISSDEWGKKRLAYEINKKQYGYYYFTRFNGPGQLIKLLEREYRLSENILRYLTLKIDEKQLQSEQRASEKSNAPTEAVKGPETKEADAKPVEETVEEKAEEATVETVEATVETAEAPEAPAEAEVEVEVEEATEEAEKEDK